MPRSQLNQDWRKETTLLYSCWHLGRLSRMMPFDSCGQRTDQVCLDVAEIKRVPTRSGHSSMHCAVLPTNDIWTVLSLTATTIWTIWSDTRISVDRTMWTTTRLCSWTVRATSTTTSSAATFARNTCCTSTATTYQSAGHCRLCDHG